MDTQVLNWWAAMRDVLPEDEVLAVAVAAELGEPLDEVRPSVMTATMVRRVDATLDDLKAVVDGERARARTRDRSPARRRAERRLRAETLADLQAETARMAANGTLDLASAIAVQRTAGAIAARTGLRLVLFLARLAVIRRLVWDRCVDEERAGRIAPDALGEMGRWIFLWTEVTSLVVTDGYRAAEREILARDAQARRGAIEEILGVVAADAYTVARIRRVAARFGLDPDDAYRIAAVAPRREADPTPERTGLDQDDLEVLASRVGHLVGSAAAGTEGAGAGIRLPAVLPLRGRLVLLARADWAGFARISAALDTILGGPAADGPGAASRRAQPSAWVAVGSPVVRGAEGLAPAVADVIDAARTAETVGLRGWVPDPGHLAVERLLLAQPDLGEAAVAHELGPLIADERLGRELIETLQVYFDSGENMREAARRLHLANRTVAYRLEKIEGLLGGPLDDASRRRLAVALLVRRLHGGGA
ncbi:MAG TPA: helix-turn-helix domain-containing protein [Candidatus Limnocylindrales bacterium]|nr:helix-turn-helix domain-containing protein [Candidatus Limnocylindrales bacterium]